MEHLNHFEFKVPNSKFPDVSWISIWTKPKQKTKHTHIRKKPHKKGNQKIFLKLQQLLLLNTSPITSCYVFIFSYFGTLIGENIPFSNLKITYPTVKSLANILHAVNLQIFQVNSSHWFKKAII